MSIDARVVAPAVADVVDRHRHVLDQLAFHADAERPGVRHVAIAVDERPRRRVVDNAAGENGRPLRVEEGSARRADDRHAGRWTRHRVEARRRIRIGSDRERARDRGGSHLGRIVGKGGGNHRPLQERLQDGELLILVHLAEPAADHGLAVTGKVVRHTDPGTKRILRLRGEILPVVANAQVEREPTVQLPLVLHVPARAVIVLLEVVLPHADPETVGIGPRIGHIEGRIGREGEEPVKLVAVP